METHHRKQNHHHHRQHSFVAHCVSINNRIWPTRGVFLFFVHVQDEAPVLFVSIQVDVLLHWHGPSPSYHSVYSSFKGDSSSSVSVSSNFHVRPVLIVLFLSTKLDWTGGGFTDDDNTLPHTVVMWWPQKGGNAHARVLYSIHTIKVTLR